jgi:diguanylate cyclase (GGDEF)-like protein
MLSRSSCLPATSLIGQLRQRAREDRLTGLLNRAAFEEFLGSRKRKAEKDRVAVILDIDHFKMVNDRLGHLVGDELLSRMSAHLMGELRQGELFRYGGDEFALLLEGEDADYATEITESLVERARRVLSPYGSSISAGLARSRNGEAPRDVFRRADVALLWAKGHARGTAVLWDEEMGTGTAPKPAA